MAAKSIIDVDVNDARFKEFLELFGKYRDEVAKLPDAWDAVGEAVDKNVGGDSVKGFQNMTAATLAVGYSLSGQLRTMNQLRQQATQTGGVFTQMAKATTTIVQNLGQGAQILMKWASIAGGVLGGLGGLSLGGGLYGLERLAGAAYGVRRSSQGLGVTPAEQQAFQINYGRYFDPNTVLGNIADAKTDLSKRWAFGAMGINDVDQQDSEQLGVEMTTRAKRLLDNLGPNAHLTKQWADAAGLSTFFGMDDLRRLQATSLSSIQGSAAQTSADTNSFNLNPQTLLNWTNFNTALERAGTLLKDTLITDLGDLTGPLTNLSSALSNALAGVLGNPQLKTDIDNLAKGINKFAQFAGTPQFAQDVDKFASGLAEMAGMLYNVVTWLGDKFPNLAAAVPGAPGSPTRGPNPTPFPMGSPSYPANPDLNISPMSKSWQWNLTHPVQTLLGNPYDFTKPGAQYGVDPQLLYGIANQESGYNARPPDTMGDPGDGPDQGMFQMSQRLQAKYGVTNPYDAGQEAYATAAYMHDLLAKYHGDVKKAAAAYNWGEPALDKDIAANGTKWLKAAPYGVQNYVTDVTRGVHMTIVNATGGNANVITNQVANQSQ